MGIDSGAPAPPPGLVSDVVDAVRERLGVRGSPLVYGAALDPDLADQIRRIVEEAWGWSVSRDGDVSFALSADADVGGLRAAQHLHPSASLAAANVVFEAALPLLIQRLGAQSAVAVEAVATALHRSIMNRIVPNAVGYVDALLNRLAAANSEARRRVSRGLHDKVAHEMLAAGQRLSAARVAGDADVRDRLIETALFQIDEAVEQTRQLAVELRQDLDGRTLHETIDSYLAESADASVDEVLTATGDPVALSPLAEEESLIIVLEAVRNAREHAAGAAQIRVDLSWAPEGLRIRVTDDGAGFEEADLKFGRSMGLLSMRERAEIIGGEFSIESRPGRGTTVTVFAPAGAR